MSRTGAKRTRNWANAFRAWATVDKSGDVRTIFFSRADARYAAKGRFRVARVKIVEVKTLKEVNR